MKRYVLIGCLICLLVTTNYLCSLSSINNVSADDKPVFLILSKTNKIAKLLEPFKQNKELANNVINTSMEKEKIIFPKDIKNFIISHNVRYALFVGDIPRENFIFNQYLNPSYFPTQSQKSDFFYAFWKFDRVDEAHLTDFLNSKPDCLVSRIKESEIELLNTKYNLDPSWLICAPIQRFPWKEGGARGEGTDWSYAFEENPIIFPGYMQVTKLYQKRGDKISPFNGKGIEDNFDQGAEANIITLLSCDNCGVSDDSCYGIWTDKNKNGFLLVDRKYDKDELECREFKFKANNSVPKILITFDVSEVPILAGICRTPEIEGGMWVYGDQNKISRGWEINWVYNIHKALLDGQAFSEIVFSLPNKIADCQVSQMEKLFQALSISCLECHGDPTMSLYDLISSPKIQFEPENIEENNELDLGYNLEGSFTIKNIGQYNLTWEIISKPEWLNIDPTFGVIKPGEKIIVHIQIVFTIPKITILQLAKTLIDIIKIKTDDPYRQNIQIKIKVKKP